METKLEKIIFVKDLFRIVTNDFYGPCHAKIGVLHSFLYDYHYIVFCTITTKYK
jgi:hypothetical protein